MVCGFQHFPQTGSGVRFPKPHLISKVHFIRESKAMTIQFVPETGVLASSFSTLAGAATLSLPIGMSCDEIYDVKKFVELCIEAERRRIIQREKENAPAPPAPAMPLPASSIAEL